MSVFDPVSLVRNVCAAGTEGYYRRLCICFLSSHNLSHSYGHKRGTGLWRSCSKSTCSVAEDKRELSAGLRLPPGLHRPRQDWWPWHVLTCVLSLCAPRAEVPPGYLTAGNAAVRWAALPQELWATLGVHSYYAFLPRLQCCPVCCWRAAAKAILCVFNTAVMDNPLQTVSFQVKVILKHHLSLIGVGRLLTIFICLHYLRAVYLMGFSFHLSGIEMVASLSSITALWQRLCRP